MGIKKTLGGDRLGSGNRMKQEMHDFYRSNKNLSCTFASTMAPGVLYPCYTNIALKGDTFDLDLNAFVRTIPTQGPLYGSFKLQVDVFQVPFRLYQAILHNNTTDIARKMNQVYLPKVLLKARLNANEVANGFKTQINESSLMRYLNISGVASLTNATQTGDQTLQRKFLAIPMLAYYDIFKNYYANKQEENAYVIAPDFTNETLYIESFNAYWGESLVESMDATNNRAELIIAANAVNYLTITGANLNIEEITLVLSSTNGRIEGTIKELLDRNTISINEQSNSLLTISIPQLTYNIISVSAPQEYAKSQISLQPFELSNIDDMRKYLLTQWDLGNEVVIYDNNPYTNMLPYSTITSINAITNKPNNVYPMNGLVVKCYQSDLFNNWLDTEWVNEITTTSAIDVSNGSFTIDTLNFKKKLYDHLNRLAISGGTYDDWQEATYGDRVWGKSEKPIYCGGMSSEVVFDEVISTAATQDEPLGTIGGQGMLNTRKGGKVTIKVGEASVIMAMVSLTPRLFYTQGNAWYNTELDTMDDLHKPIFDRIGFQDLMVEQMAWWDAKLDPQSGGPILRRTSAGKQPAWMNYATDYDKAYGDFAKQKGVSYMILSRDYEQDEYGFVKDVTTYIDPRKFNYAFAYDELDAQNFWTFIKFQIHARRKMSNTQIPNV